VNGNCKASAQLTGSAVTLRLRLPVEMAQHWADSDQVSLSVERDANGGPSLLVEKDFQCLCSDERNLSEDVDSYPIPSADDQER
jgi:hypothetical protein